MIRLYDWELSGNCYKVRLLLAVLGVAYERRVVDYYPGKEHKSDWFLGINPLGQLPALDDGGFLLRDAQAILVYLASSYDVSGSWFPRADPKLTGQIAMWLAFADSLTATASAARLHDSIGHEADIEKCRAGAHSLFRVMDEHLWLQDRQGQPWLCPADRPTIADIACFPYVMLSEEGGIPRIDYPAIRRWGERVKRIPGFVAMPGILPAAPLG